MLCSAVTVFTPSTTTRFSSGTRPNSFNLPPPALPFVFASLSHEFAQSLRLERLAVERPRVIKRDEEGNAVRPPTVSADVALSLEDLQPLVYRARAQLLGFLHSSFVKNRKLSLPMMKLAT